VNAILDLRLYQLTGLERESIKTEYDDLLETIKDLLDILAKEARVLKIIKEELREIRTKYGSERLTQIVPDEGEINMEDLIANEGCIITITHNGFIKRTAVSAYRAQRRGGKGVIGMTTREGMTEDDGDFVEHLFTATTHDYLMFFTTSGRCYVERVYEIPEMAAPRKDARSPTFSSCAARRRLPQPFVSRVKRPMKDLERKSPRRVRHAQRYRQEIEPQRFKNIRKGGIIAIQIEEGDQLIDCKLTTGLNEIVLITKEGMSIRFNEEELRDQGRNTVGVWGIRPDKGDHIIGAAIVSQECMLLVAGENGIGKRTIFDEYRIQSRGGKGVITMKTTDKTAPSSAR